jgi:hypothetical protein
LYVIVKKKENEGNCKFLGLSIRSYAATFGRI